MPGEHSPVARRTPGRSGGVSGPSPSLVRPFGRVVAILLLAAAPAASSARSDPFRLWKYELVSRDASYLQSNTPRGTMRRTALTLGWNWGKPPETRARRPSGEEQPPSEPPQPMR